MVIKGKARGGAAALAAHLQRHDTNEEIRLRDFEGVTSRDVLGALREMDAMGSGAASRRTLYHAAISPGERLTEDQKREAVERLAEELGFKDRPRIVVEHLKKDREHMHVVFLRIDTDRMVAISDSHNYRKHEIVARDLERQFGHDPIQGAHVGRDGKDRPGRTPSHSEMQQAERSGIPPQQAKEEVTRLWRLADSGKAFAASAASEGWILAKGDKRDFVLIDRAGEPHSLARRVEGAKVDDIRQRMSDVDPSTLPTVTEAKAMQRSEAKAGRTKEKEKQKTHTVQAADPVLLKVDRPQETSPAASLELSKSAARPIDKKPIKEPATEKANPPQPKPEVEKQRQPGPIKRLYDSAATAVQRAYQKARGSFDPKPRTQATSEQRPERPRAATKRALPEKEAPKLSPVQQDMKQRMAQARAADRQQLTAPTDRMHTIKHDVQEGRERNQTRERGHKLSREDIELLLERQRRQHDLNGPTR